MIPTTGTGSARRLSHPRRGVAGLR